MPRVPVVEQQVGLREGSAPKGTVSGPVAGAFGENVGEAISNVGKSGQDLGMVAINHIQRQNYWRMQEQVYDLSNKFHVDVQNAQFNNETKTIKGSDNQDYDIPVGVLNRKGNQAHGATQEFDATVAGLKSQYLGQVKNPMAQKLLTRLIDSEYNTSREQVIKHETGQINDAAKHTYLSSLDNQANQAEIAQDPESLGKAIDVGMDTVGRMADRVGMDTETTTKNANEWLSKATEKAVIGKLKTTGKTEDAMSLLDSVKKKLPPEVYEGLTEKIDKTGDIMEKQQQRDLKNQVVQARFDTIGQLANGKIDWSNSSDVIHSVSQSDPELAEALKKVSDSSSDFQTDKVDEEAYEGLVKDVFSSGNKEEVGKFLVKTLNSNANGSISRDRLAILVNAAIKRGQSLPLQNADGSPKSSVQISMEAGLKAAIGWNDKNDRSDPGVYDDYLKGIADGKPVKESYDQAIKNSMQRKFPQTATMDAAPNAVMSASQGLKAYMPGKTDAKANFTIAEGAVVPKTKTTAGKKEGGRLMKDAAGNKAIVYPDGTFEEQ